MNTKSRKLSAKGRDKLSVLGMAEGINQYILSNPPCSIYHIKQPDGGIFISEDWDRAMWVYGEIGDIRRYEPCHGEESLRVRFSGNKYPAIYIYKNLKDQRLDILAMKAMAGLTAIALAFIPINLIISIIIK